MWTYLLKSDIDKYTQKYNFFEEYKQYLTLLETEDAIFLPRLFYFNYPHECLKIYNGIDNREPGKVNFTFNIKKSRPDKWKFQEPIIRHVLKLYQKQGYVNGIIKARPGLGKTVLSVYIASKIGLKTIIVVDNDQLMKQWIKAFYTFTNLTEKDIGIIKSSLMVVDKPVTIAMAQTLSRRISNNLKTIANKIAEGRFGLVIYDEVHNTSSSEKYAKVSILFKTRNILGLSATPFQIQWAELLMKNTVGNIIYESNDYDLTPRYILYYYDSKMSSNVYRVAKKNGRKITYAEHIGYIRDDLAKRSFYNKLIVQSEKYLEVIYKNVKALYENDHVTMVMVATINQVKTISEYLSKHGLENRQFYSKKTNIDKENDKIVVATYGMCGKGFDWEKLSAIVYGLLLAGRKSLIQTAGRIVRSYKNKKQPILIDLIDLSFASLFVPKVAQKKNIIKNEFKCSIREVKDEEIEAL